MLAFPVQTTRENSGLKMLKIWRTPDAIAAARACQQSRETRQGHFIIRRKN
jgi:hypothetical protein